MSQSNAPNQGGHLHCQPRERGVKYSMWWGRGSRKHQQGMRKRTGKRGHWRVTYEAGPPEIGWRGVDALRKEQRGLTHSGSPLAVRGRWVAQLPPLSSCREVLLWLPWSQGSVLWRELGVCCFGCVCFLITTSRSHFLWAYVVRLGQPEPGGCCVGNPALADSSDPQGPLSLQVRGLFAQVQLRMETLGKHSWRRDKPFIGRTRSWWRLEKWAFWP